VTAVAIWPEDGQLWVIADTRISSDPGAVLTDVASKIYGLPVVCRPPNLLGTLHKPQPYFEGTFGVAFAGSSLAATQTIAMASSCLTQLVAQGASDGPSASDVAQFVQRIGNEIGRQVAERSNFQSLNFELAIFGWCPQLRRFAVYKLFPDPHGNPPGTTLALKQALPISIEHLVTLGNGGARVAAQVDELRATGGLLKHKPKIAIARILEADDRADLVGGSLSIASCIAQPGGFQMYSWARPSTPPNVGMRLVYNGLDVDDILGEVGPYRINFVGFG
jgi:hypothetical protein